MPILKLAKCPSCGKAKVEIEGLLLCCDPKAPGSNPSNNALYYTSPNGPLKIHLTPSSKLTLQLLLCRYPAFVPAEDIISTLYPNPDLEPDWAVSSLSVTIWNLRNSFIGTGLWIVCWTSRGYALTINKPETIVRRGTSRKRKLFWRGKVLEGPKPLQSKD